MCALQASSLSANQQQKNLVTSIWLLLFLPLTSLVPQEPSVGRNQAFLQDLNDKPKLILKEFCILGHVDHRIMLIVRRGLGSVLEKLVRFLDTETGVQQS